MQGSLSTSVQRAPDYQLHRIVTAADGAPALLVKGNGIRVDGRRTLMVQIVPIAQPNPPADLAGVTAGTSNPTATVRFWDPLLGKFIKHVPAIALTAQGAGEASELTIDACGRTVMIEITGGIAGGEAVAILASSFEHDETL